MRKFLRAGVIVSASLLGAHGASSITLPPEPDYAARKAFDDKVSSCVRDAVFSMLRITFKKAVSTGSLRIPLVVHYRHDNHVMAVDVPAIIDEPQVGETATEIFSRNAQLSQKLAGCGVIRPASFPFLLDLR